jgi:hypothetical protein
VRSATAVRLKGPCQTAHAPARHRHQHQHRHHQRARNAQQPALRGRVVREARRGGKKGRPQLCVHAWRSASATHAWPCLRLPLVDRHLLRGAGGVHHTSASAAAAAGAASSSGMAPSKSRRGGAAADPGSDTPQQDGAGTGTGTGSGDTGGGSAGGSGGGGGGGRGSAGGEQGAGSSGSGGAGVNGPPRRVTTQEVQHVQVCVDFARARTRTSSQPANRYVSVNRCSRPHALARNACTTLLAAYQGAPVAISPLVKLGPHRCPCRHTHTCTCTHTHALAHTRTRTNTAHTHTHTCVHAHTHTCVRVHRPWGMHAPRCFAVARAPSMRHHQSVALQAPSTQTLSTTTTLPDIYVTGSGSAKDLGGHDGSTLTAHFLNLNPPEAIFMRNYDFHTFRGEILAVSTRRSRAPIRPISPRNLTPQTHFFGVRGGQCKH